MTKNFSRDALRSIIESHLAKRNWDVKYKLSVDFEPRPEIAKAYIDLLRWNITEVIDPAVSSRLEAILMRENMRVDDPVRKFLCAVCDHEESHWSVCPYDRSDTESILFGIGQGLRSAGIPDKDVPLLTKDTFNLFADYVVNGVRGLDTKDFPGYSEGLGLFYLNALSLPASSATFTLFIDAQMKLWGSDASAPPAGIIASVLGRRGASFRTIAEKNKHYSRRLRADAELLAKSMLPGDLGKEIFTQPISASGAEDAITDLLLRDSWERKARQFAQILAPYIKRDTKPPKDSKGQRPGDGDANSRGEGGPPQPGSDIARQILDDPAARKDLMRRAIGKGRGIGPSGMPYLGKTQAYTVAYDLAAAEIILRRTRDDEDSPPSFDLLHMRDRRIDDAEQSPRTMHWAKTYFVPREGKEETWMHRKEVPYSIEEQLLPGRRSLEDILFVLDVSGSMDWSGKPLDNSKYDLALKAAFGVIKYLESMGRAAHAKFGVVLFSDSTAFSGWKDYAALDGFKEFFFTGHQGGGTRLDPHVMKQVLNENPRKFLTILISDGDISGDDAPSILKSYLDRGNDVAYFSIRGCASFRDQLARHGAKIVDVTMPSDLTDLVLDTVQDRYR